MSGKVAMLKSIHLVIILCCLTHVLVAQTNLATKPDTLNSAFDIKPEFPGGEDSLVKFLMKNWKYHEDKLCHFPTTVHVEFIVKENGEIENLKLLKPIEATVHKEITRVFKQMPKWQPALKDGQPVEAKYFLPIYFRF